MSKPVSAETLVAVMEYWKQPRPPVNVTAQLLADVMQAQIDEREREKAEKK